MPHADPDVVGRGLAVTCLDEVFETQHERCPLRAAMFGELDRLAPVPVTEFPPGSEWPVVSLVHQSAMPSIVDNAA